MRPGRLRNLVVIERLGTASPARSAVGQSIENWTEVGQVWASIEPLLGREYLAAQQQTTRADIRIRLRYTPGVTDALTPKDRIRYAATIYLIDDVLDVNMRHAELIVMAYIRSIP